MDQITVNHNNLPEAVQAIYKELVDTRNLLYEVMQKLDKYSSAPQLPDNFDDLLTIPEACAFLKVTQNTLHRWKRNRTIPYQKIGTRTYFKKSDLEQYNKIEVKKPKGLKR
ncbi:helix-turn-helix domain-containing protein [Sphingobacterium thalpophilum]|uniref:helix-turn-helix domain-containing protein n=1 Tax=Sphingobacterium thalpophilum TaxID=259 RepID=UPI0024A67B3E|nr:helix-turn-helix domain-containing protein [Sphingobacterium thalpophilum]